MLVSIIINNFNYGKFLDAAIKSALDQTYAQVETIVVDDGSTDNSLEIAASFGNRITLVAKPNGGQGSAFNSGFKRAAGTLVLFLDSDDTLHPEAIATVIAEWQPEFVKLHFHLDAVDSLGCPLNKRFPPGDLDSGSVLPKLLKNGDYCSPPTTGNVFSAVFLSSVMPMPETEWRDCADCYLVTSAPFFGQIGTISSCLGTYRFHGASLTALSSKGRLLPESFGKRLRSDIRKQKLLNRMCECRNYDTKPQMVVLSTYHHLRLRLASLKMFPNMHPFESDRLIPTLLKTIKATLLCQSITPMTRIALCVWGIWVAGVPRALAEPFIIAGISPYSRSLFWTILMNSVRANLQVLNRREERPRASNCRT